MDVFRECHCPILAEILFVWQCWRWFFLFNVQVLERRSKAAARYRSMGVSYKGEGSNFLHPPKGNPALWLLIDIPVNHAHGYWHLMWEVCLRELQWLTEAWRNKGAFPSQTVSKWLQNLLLFKRPFSRFTLSSTQTLSCHFSPRSVFLKMDILLKGQWGNKKPGFVLFSTKHNSGVTSFLLLNK